MATLSKREQARNERELQTLVQQPGNSLCADCATRNPGWASWNLGIFLCVRCASIHRKLGTHISKVKSLSMDKWSSDQVETMKQQGNIASNKIYNPKNRKPDIPIDADEVDSAMERYIRKKYQEKSLVDGRPEPPSRAEVSPSLTQSSQPSPNPELPLPGKKHKFFGFSLRTSSRKDRPGLDSAFKITPVEYSPTSGYTRDVSDRELQEKLAQLNDMGFPDNERNLNILKRSGGDLERSIASLVKLSSTESTKKPTRAAPPRSTEPSASTSAPPSAGTSNNPWEQLDKPTPTPQPDAGFGISFGGSQEQAQLQAQPQPLPQSRPQPPSANPWQNAMAPEQPSGLEQQFASLQVSHPLFPHHTGGYAASGGYQDPRYQTLTPPVPTLPQQYGYTTSPSSPSSNPFYQQSQPMSSQSTGNNPFLQQQQGLPIFAPNLSSNPFLAMQSSQTQPAQFSNANPFGLPPPQAQLQMPPQQSSQAPQVQSQSSNPFGVPAQASPPSMQYSQSVPLMQQQQQSQSPQTQMPNLQYGEAQHQLAQSQSAYYLNQQLQPQSRPQPLQPQATGRYTKTDIMALFSQPSVYQQQNLAPVQEARDEAGHQQTQLQQAQPQVQPLQQFLSPVPSNNPYGATSQVEGRRAATMPVSPMSNMHSSGGIGSRNPFLSAPTSGASAPSAQPPFGQPQQQFLQPTHNYAPQSWNSGTRHASNESVSVNNQTLMDGRHSPDAFASLSSRY